ncbi:MAG TPA: hypothetical protein PKN99_05895 [Cyclobacteriaceae bacterium]|nr:hypothetical protein [Cyclobacteriaceae bacterium]
MDLTILGIPHSVNYVYKFRLFTAIRYCLETAIAKDLVMETDYSTAQELRGFFNTILFTVVVTLGFVFVLIVVAINLL